MMKKSQKTKQYILFIVLIIAIVGILLFMYNKSSTTQDARAELEQYLATPVEDYEETYNIIWSTGGFSTEINLSEKIANNEVTSFDLTKKSWGGRRIKPTI
ncbi:hypothetical protein HZA99_05650 [Candidatus Woesearchaeota archaeon]|nr:hypothetical protein [Candidatus Woesearchaeota archaeon]